VGSSNSANYFVRGDMVEVLSEEEIARTLDANGQLDGLVFMPEMRRYFGRRFRVFRRAEKTCVEGHGMRRMEGAVFLEDVRCEGSQHDGCQRNCLIFWKEQWLKPAKADDVDIGAMQVSSSRKAQVAYKVRQDDGNRYFCQSTELFSATTEWPQQLLAETWREFREGELGIIRVLHIAARMAINRFRSLLGLRSLGVLEGSGKIRSKGDLCLRPGEKIEVRSCGEIEETLNSKSKNVGLTFDAEMAVFAGKEYEVDSLVERIISEETGKMVNLTNTVVLKGVRCTGLCYFNCPRNNPIYWREIWLKRT
jgi:hypothetical protein